MKKTICMILIAAFVALFRTSAFLFSTVTDRLSYRRSFTTALLKEAIQEKQLTVVGAITEESENSGDIMLGPGRGEI